MKNKNMINCNLVKITSRNNRISLIFSKSNLKSPPMRTMDIKNGENNKKSIFEIYSLIILGFIPNIEEYSSQEICDLFLKKSKGKNFLLQVNPSICRRYTDIIKIVRGS